MIALLFIASVAHASCLPRRAWVVDPQRTVAEHQPLVFGATLHPGRHLEQHRLRGPDGRLLPVRAEQHGYFARLIPEHGWPEGGFTVEKRVYVDADGHPTPHDRLDHSVHWFVLQHVNVVVEPEIRTLEGVEWTVQPGRFQDPVVRAMVPTPEGTRWIELEVESAGIVESVLRVPPSAWGTTPVRTDGGVCEHDPIGLPLGEPLKVRVVAHSDGVEHVSAWHDVGVLRSGALEPTPVESQWEEVSVWWPRTPTEVRTGSCTTLERVDTRQTPVPDGSYLLFDQRRTAHVVSVQGGVYVDGQRIDGLRRPVRLVRQGERSVFLTEQPARLVGVERGVVVAEHLLGTNVTPVELDLDGSIGATVRDPAGRRWLHRVSFDLQPVAEPALVVDPVELVEHEPGTWTINGHSVHVHPDATGHVMGRFVWFGGVRLPSRDMPFWVFDREGALQFHRLLPNPDAVGVDEEGVVIRTNTGAATVIEGWTFDGSERWSAEVPRTVQQPDASSTTRLPWGDRVLATDGQRAWVETPSGASTAVEMEGPVGVRPDPLDDEQFVVTAIEMDPATGDLLRTEVHVRCTDAGTGIPARWEGL